MTTAALDRRIQMLRTAMGPLIAAALEDPDVVEIMLNPDRTLWVDRLSSGRAPMGVEMPEADGERIIRLVAAHVGAEVHRGRPLLSAELPETGERFEGVLPPVVAGPTFALRKRAAGVIPLQQYVADGILSAAQAEYLRVAVRERQNILVAGGTSSGKTTLANALLAEVAGSGDRVLVLEDTVELQCPALDHVALRTKPGVVCMADLVRSTLRLRPDRVVVGEVRGGEALDLVKAWGTGHPGGIATIHAGSAQGALLRLEQLILEVALTAPRALITEAVNLVVFLAGRGRTRYVQQIARVIGHDERGYQLTSIAPAFIPSLTQENSHDCLPSPRPGGAHHRGDHHHFHRPDAGFRRHQRRLSQADPDRLWPVDCLRRFVILPQLLQLRRRGGDRMNGEHELIPGFEVPLHRSLAEPILLSGAPRNVAILNGTLAAVVGLGLQLWLPGLALWLVGHSLAVWGARLDPQFLQVFARHIKQPSLLDV
ncbi:hypothetical protein G6F24_012926 [Rhizopus arrhizus]|nr:hypothetical protein G6F24_012926 [Rhizopus arrhizus]